MKNKGRDKREAMNLVRTSQLKWKAELSELFKWKGGEGGVCVGCVRGCDSQFMYVQF